MDKKKHKSYKFFFVKYKLNEKQILHLSGIAKLIDLVLQLLNSALNKAHLLSSQFIFVEDFLLKNQCNFVQFSLSDWFRDSCRNAYRLSFHTIRCIGRKSVL